MRMPHPPRRTVRLRLTIVYSGLFLVSGAALLAITYLLMTGRIVGGQLVFTRRVDNGQDASPRPEHTPLRGSDPTQLHQFLTLAGIALGVMLVVSIVLGWLMAGRVLRPLRTITAKTRQISEANLHRRLAVTGPDDELKDLADTIDGLLTRLDDAFDTQQAALEAQRSFVANASHELRRPLTLERAALEIALADPDATSRSLRETCERVLAASKQQETLIDALLTLARGQRGLDHHEPFDLAALTDEVLLARRDEITRRRLHVVTRLEHTPALGDPHLAERLVTNLVDNAIRHNLPAGRIDITTTGMGDRAVLSVANSGHTIRPSEVDRILGPFQRLGADRTNPGDGHGLGLSIVAAIATAHHATLHMRAQPTGGLHIEVHFPPPPDPHRDNHPSSATPLR